MIIHRRQKTAKEESPSSAAANAVKTESSKANVKSHQQQNEQQQEEEQRNDEDEKRRQSSLHHHSMREKAAGSWDYTSNDEEVECDGNGSSSSIAARESERKTASIEVEGTTSVAISGMVKMKLKKVLNQKIVKAKKSAKSTTMPMPMPSSMTVATPPTTNAIIEIETMIIDSPEKLELQTMKALNQCNGIFDSSTATWSVVKSKGKDVSIYSKMPGSDILRSRDLPLMRSCGKVPMNAETLYRHIITKEGYQLLDPDSHPDDFDKPILGPVEIMQPDNGHNPIHSQLEYAYMPLGPISARDFVVMNVKDPTTLTFFSTSVLASSPHAGGSVYSSYLGKSYVGTSMSPNAKPKKRVVRAALCSGYRCTPIPGQMNECNFEMFQFLDLGGSLPATISKFGNKSYLQAVYGRLREFAGTAEYE